MEPAYCFLSDRITNADDTLYLLRTWIKDKNRGSFPVTIRNDSSRIHGLPKRHNHN
jgi:hypothetical protein